MKYSCSCFQPLALGTVWLRSRRRTAFRVLRLGGKGLPDVNGYGRGDELVVVDITIPSKLSAEEKRLIEQLAQQPGFQHAESVKNQNIFERMKNFFQ